MLYRLACVFCIAAVDVDVGVDGSISFVLSIDVDGSVERFVLSIDGFVGRWLYR